MDEKEKFIEESVKQYKEKPFNPLDSVYTRREYKDGSEEEAKAIQMEKDKAYEKLRQMPPNCS